MDEVFDNDANDEFSEVDELDFEMSDFAFVDVDELNGMLFELKVKDKKKYGTIRHISTQVDLEFTWTIDC